MEKKYAITLTREQYIVVKTTLNQEMAKAFMENDKLAFEMLQSAYRTVTAATEANMEDA